MIRRLDRPEDYGLCADIWLESSLAAHDFIPASFWRDQRSMMAERYLPGSAVYLAIDEGSGRILGFAALDGPRLAALFVRPEDQGRGVGRTLLNYLFDRKDELSLAVYLKNGRAIAFYLRQGFESGETGVCPHTGEAEMTMRWHKKTPVNDEGLNIWSG